MVSIIMLFSDDGQRTELKDHLSLNGYDVCWKTDCSIVVSEDDLSYIKTILNDRGILNTVII